MRLTPHVARFYLLLAAFLLALPSLAGLYKGQSGRILVAEEYALEGGSFYRSVVYIADHNLTGAVGFIVNAPLPEGDFMGGPVAPEGIAVMGRDETGAIRFGSAATRDSRVFHGYAGWGVFQLNYEIGRGYWYVIDYDPALVFDTPPEEMWGAARQRVLEQLKIKDKNVL